MYKQIKDLPFYNDIINAGGTIYQVGGAVRDSIIGKQSKDLDIVIANIPSDKLKVILEKYGNVNLVGESFGVIKFREFNKPISFEIDIALPREDRKNDKEGHKGFDIKSNPFLPIEKDLFRRDITINSIAKDHKGNIIDPYGGIDDIKNKRIKATNPEAFIDDPLRMLRAIAFASRFGFKIEKNTFEMIKKYASGISTISPERIVTEFEKIVKKGNIQVAIKYLVETGLYEHIFDKNFDGSNSIKKVDTVGEFFYILMGNEKHPDRVWMRKFKGDGENEKILLSLSMQHKPVNTDGERRLLMFSMMKAYPNVIYSPLLNQDLKKISKQFITGQYPRNIKEIEINGHDLMNVGYKEKEIGIAMKNILVKIMNDKLENNKQKILEYLNE